MSEPVRMVLRVLPFLIIILGIGMVIRNGRVKKEDLFLQKPLSIKRFALWWVLFLLLIIITEVSLYHLDLLKVGQWDNGFWSSVIKITGIVILAPIAEELVFRGLILYKLKQFKVNLHLSIFVQALIFLLLHSLSFDNTFSSNFGIVQIFVDAVLFAYAKEHTKSLYTPMAMHATGNSIAVLEQFIL